MFERKFIFLSWSSYEGSGPILIGRDWLSQLCPDWQAIHRLQDQPVCEVLEKHKAVFEEGRNREGFEAELQVDPYATKVLQGTLCFVLYKGPRRRGA